MTSGSLYRRCWRPLTLLLTVLLAGPSAASEMLYQQARAYLDQALQPQLQPGDRTELLLRPIDSRLHLPACAFPINFEHSRAIEPGAFSLKAECAGPKRWSVYLSGSAEIYRQVVTSRRPLPKGTRLTPTMLALGERPLSQLRQGYYVDPASLVDFLTRRSLSANQVLLARHLSPPLLIREGEQVTIQAGGSQLTVETKGVALEDGRLDQQIRVKNSRSERIIRARVAGKGLVTAR